MHAKRTNDLFASLDEEKGREREREKGVERDGLDRRNLLKLPTFSSAPSLRPTLSLLIAIKVTTGYRRRDLNTRIRLKVYAHRR